MSADNESIIVKLIEQEAEARKRETKGIYKNMEAGFDMLAKKMDEVKESKGKQDIRVDKLEKATRINDFVIRNPKTAIFLVIVSEYILLLLVDTISITDLLKKYLPF